MKSIKKVITGTMVAAMAGGGILLGASPASAATAPPWEPDPNALGTLSFYDASGNVVTSGNNLSHLFDYALASTDAARSGTTKATLYFGFPDHTKSDTTSWSAVSASASTTFPNSNYPAPLNNTGRRPLGHPGPSDANLASPLGVQTLDQTDGYKNLVQVRLKDSGPGNGFQTQFWDADIMFDQAAGTWTQVYPAPPAPAPSISTPTANPASPAEVGTSVALSATVTNPAPGSVHLFDGTTDKGAATYNATTGAVSATDAPAVGNHSYKFTLTPTDTSVTPVSSAALSYTVNPVTQHATTTVVSGPTTGTVGDTVTYTATVKNNDTNAAVTSGTVQFKVDGANAGNAVPVSNGVASFPYNLADTTSHTITAAYTATAANLAGSADTTGVTVTATAATSAPDPQDVVVNVPAGTLVISTPYTNANPFVLGNLVLDANGTGYSASASFGNTTATAGNGTADAEPTTGKLPAGATPAQVAAAKAAQQSGLGNGITITDTRANSQGWLASAQTTDFTNPALNTPIDGNNLTFHDLKVKYVAGNAIQSGVNVNDISAFKTAKKSFATNTNHTPGTVAIAGTLTLTAPTSTKAGQYTATITFTVV